MWLDFKITNRCNNNCLYCGVKHDKITKPEILSEKEINATIKDALSIGFNNFAFLGGEPSVRENIENLFSAFDQKYDTNLLVITNGLIYNEKMYKSAFKSNATNVNIIQSFDSFNSPNIKNQNPKKILQSIQRIKQLSEEYSSSNLKRNVAVHSVISRENYTDIYKLVDYFIKKEIDISLALVCPSHFDTVNSPTEYNHFNYKELEIILAQLIQLKSDNKLNFANNILLEYLQKYPYGKINMKTTCNAGKKHVVINPDGNVYPCITESYSRGLKYGNIKKLSFKEIYKKMQSFECQSDFKSSCWDHYLWNKLD